MTQNEHNIAVVLESILKEMTKQTAALNNIAEALKNGGNFGGAKSRSGNGGNGGGGVREVVEIEIEAVGDFKPWGNGNGYNFTALLKSGENVRCGAKNEVDIRENDKAIVEGAYSGTGEKRIFWVDKVKEQLPNDAATVTYESAKKKPVKPIPAPYEPSIDEDIPF